MDWENKNYSMNFKYSLINFRGIRLFIFLLIGLNNNLGNFMYGSLFRNLLLIMQGKQNRKFKIINTLNCINLKE